MDDTIPTTSRLTNSNMKVRNDISIAIFTFCEGFDLTLSVTIYTFMFEWARRAVEDIVSSIIVWLVKMKFDNLIR